MGLSRRPANTRAMLFLAAPLVVGGALLWQWLGTAAPTAAIPEQRLDSPPQIVSMDEWEAARAEFDGIADSTLQCRPEEMPAYWRLIKWSLQQPDFESPRSSFSTVSYNELVNQPGVFRGRPVQLDLHIRRIAEYAAPANSLGIERLYEVWGWSEDSRGSLFVAVTPELPPGMAVGESVTERARISGYFYKIQGYVTAGSTPQSSLTTAPLIIGRISQGRLPVAAFANWNDFWFGAAGLFLAGSFLWLLSQKPIFRNRLRERLAPHATAKLVRWLDSNPVVSEIA